jgi:hypothetical protein
LADLASAHGRCHTDGKLKVNNLTRGSWRMVCDRGELTFVAVLSPDGNPRLQTLLWEDSLPPSALLERSAEAATGWIHAWDEKAAKKVLAPSMDVERTRRTMSQAAAKYGSCKLDHAVTSDGATTGKFLLACTEGALELSVTVDPKTQRITRPRAVPPRTMANCAP